MNDSAISLVLWLLCVISSIGTIYSYFNFRAKEKRLPLATEYLDLQTRCALEKDEIERLKLERTDYEEIKAEREQFIAEVEQARKRIDFDRQELQKLDGERNSQETLRQELQLLKEKCASETERLRQILSDCAVKEAVKANIEKEIDQLKQQRKQLNEEKEELLDCIKGYETTCQDHKTKMDNLHTDETRLGDSIAKMKEELNILIVQKEKYDQIAFDLIRVEKQKEELGKNISELNTRRESMQAEEIELQESILALTNAKKNEEANLKKVHKQQDELKKEYNELVKERDKAQSTRNVLQQECELYQGKIKAHKEKTEEKNTFEELVKPYFKIKVENSIEVSENDALQRLEKSLSNNNLFYSKRLLHSFHASLKINEISPLVVLSGISGTGKSQLPHRYSEAMGIHFLNMAVQPRWDSPQDIFGFYNYLENRYKATELTQALLQADRYNQQYWSKLQGKNYPVLENQMMLVLFDEMNLARVEYYFSDFLSKLELRRGINPSHQIDRQKAEIILDGGCHEQGQRLYVDRNVLFVGTMNEDESTQSLSDKILDRANMLRFGKPSEFNTAKALSDTHTNKTALTYDNWKKWVKTPDQIPANERKELDKIIQNLNDAMDLIGRPFGYRTNIAIQNYVANYPKVNNGSSFNMAVADQIEQRILPKLRNVSCNEPKTKNALDRIGNLIEQLHDDELWVAFNESKEGDFFEWKGTKRP